MPTWHMRRSFRFQLPLVAGVTLATVSSLFAQPFPTSATTAAQDRAQMMAQVGATPTPLPSKLLDPNRPPSAYPQSAANPEGNWRNQYGHNITRSAWGLWNNYEDTADGMLHMFGDPAGFGFNGWNKFTVNDPDSWRLFSDATSTYAQGGYTPIDLLKMNDGTPVTTAEQWWTERRPEIFKDLQEQLYGKVPDQSIWPNWTWSAGAITTGTTNGVAWRRRTITGVITPADLATYWAARGFNDGRAPLRNSPVITATVQIPTSVAPGTKVPVMIGFGGAGWNVIGPRGWGLINFSQGTVQAGGGAAMSSYLIGLFNGGAWRKPEDMGTLAAWAFGVSRLIDYLEANNGNPALDLVNNVNTKKLGVEGHSFLGKATMVTMAYEPRILIAYPSRGGSGGPKMNRRHWGQDLENSLGSDSEYYWYAGNAFKFVGPLNGTGSGTVANATDLPASGPYPDNNLPTWRTNYPMAGTSTTPGTYLPRKLELLTVDAHSMVALAAPRPVFTNGGTHDSWTDQRGMWLTQVYATPVYNLLGRRGLVDRAWPVTQPSHPVPDSPVTIHTPVFRNFGGYTDGHLGYRYAGENLYTGAFAAYIVNPTTEPESGSGGGHTDADDYPTFAKFAAKFFDDVTPPSIGVPTNITTLPTSEAGAVVTFAAPLALDSVDDQTPVTLNHQSGEIYPIGTTTVTATSTDVSSNTGTESFTITVTPMTVTRGGFLLNRRTNQVAQQVTLKNVSSAPVTAPILLLNSLSSNTSLVNRTGTTGSGSPYIASAATLSPGASLTLTLQFTNPATGGISYNPQTPASL